MKLPGSSNLSPELVVVFSIYPPPLLYVAELGEGVFHLFKDRQSAILGVWPAPGAPDTLPKGGGVLSPPFGRVYRAPGAAQTPKMTDFRSLNKRTFFLATQSAATFK